MNGSRLSILTLYNYDPTIFDDLTLPVESELPTNVEYITPITPLDKSLLIDFICTDLAELSLAYTDPLIVKPMIRIWSATQHDVWLKLWQTLLFKFNPIWNKDGTFDESINRNGRTDGGAETTFGHTIAHNVTGYDTNSYSPDTQDVNGGKDSTTTGAMFSNAEATHRTEKGNIGVTTTQQMIREQREIVEFNLYEYIKESFKERFCVMVY